MSRLTERLDRYVPGDSGMLTFVQAFDAFPEVGMQLIDPTIDTMLISRSSETRLPVAEEVLEHVGGFLHVEDETTDIIQKLQVETEPKIKRVRYDEAVKYAASWHPTVTPEIHRFAEAVMLPETKITEIVIADFIRTGTLKPEGNAVYLRKVGSDTSDQGIMVHTNMPAYKYDRGAKSRTTIRPVTPTRVLIPV